MVVFDDNMYIVYIIYVSLRALNNSLIYMSEFVFDLNRHGVMRV